MAEQTKQEIIGDYRLRGCLQTGQSSQVYEVVEVKSNRHFAMKILLPEHVTNAAKRAELFHEAEVGIKMRHENVINIVKVNRNPKQPYFIMEFFPSGSLRNRLLPKDPRVTAAKDMNADKEFLKQNARKIFRQMATGLAYMNASGYVHRDVKPDNILVNASGQLKIIDFAISKKIPTGFAKWFYRKKRPQGTRSYMSPQQIRDEKPDPRMDVYSYGCTLYELTTGRPPFRGANENDLLSKHMVEKPPSPVMLNPDLTDEFGTLVLKTLAKKNEDRYKGFHEVLLDLKKIRIFKSFDDREEQ
jgi:serine/threonine protein kinase